jgi:hypothetical protein
MHHKALMSFGAIPFNIVCLWKHLQLQTGDPVDLPPLPKDLYCCNLDAITLKEYRNIEAFTDIALPSTGALSQNELSSNESPDDDSLIDPTMDDDVDTDHDLSKYTQDVDTNGHIGA